MQGLTLFAFTQTSHKTAIGTKTSDRNSPGQHTECQGLLGPWSEDCSGNQSPPSELPSDQKSQQIPFWLRALIRCRRIWLRAGIHMEIHDREHGADRAVHYNRGEGRTDDDKEVLSCLQSPPSSSDVKSSVHSASFIYCNAKSNMDFLPSPLHLCPSAAGWKVANQRQWSSVTQGGMREWVTDEHW